MEEGEDGYRKILICRPNVTMDEDIGFYLEQRKKNNAFYETYFDNLEILVDSDERKDIK